MPHILMITHWTGGDVIPFIRLGNILKKSGYDMTISTHIVYKDMIEGYGMEFSPLDTKDEYDELMEHLIDISDPINNKKGTIEFYQKYHGKNRLAREIEMLCGLCREDTVILYRHGSSISGLMVAEIMGLPASAVFLAPNYLAHLDIQEQLFGQEMVQIINESRESFSLKPIKNWTGWMMSPKAKLCLWPEWFSETELCEDADYFHIGFMVQNDAPSVNILKHSMPKHMKEFINNNDNIVIITGGTSRTVDPEFYRVSADACILGKRAAIMILPFDDWVPDHIPQSILRVKSAPMLELMSKAAAVIHHGGIGTASEALLLSLPQVILPHSADRPDNAHRLNTVGIAHFVPRSRWSAENVLSALRLSENIETVKKCNEYSKYMQDQDITSNLIRFIEMLHNEDKYKSFREEGINIDSHINEKAEKKEIKQNRYILDLIRRKKQIEKIEREME